jgi:hypothetical protein
LTKIRAARKSRIRVMPRLIVLSKCLVLLIKEFSLSDIRR